MKKRVCSWLYVAIYIICIGSVMAACYGNGRRNAMGRQAMRTPALGERNVEYLVTEVADTAGRVALFRFHEGRLVGGYSTDYGMVTIDFAPLEMEVEYQVAGIGGTASGSTDYRRIRMTPEGYVAAMDFRQKEVLPAGEGYMRDGSIHVSYTPEGQVSLLRYVYDDSRGFRVEGNMKYYWRDGDLQNVLSDFFRSDNSYERHRMISFIYGEADTLLPNSGIYWEQMMPSLNVVHDFMWYGGMLGKPTESVPLRVLCETMGDGMRHKEQWDIRAEYDDRGLVRSVCYGDSLYRSYSYGRVVRSDETMRYVVDKTK